jgi:phospho-N-acetylmuramoyl-pentapeptide-transferase
MIGQHEILGFWIAFLISAFLSLPIMKLLVAMKSRQTVSQHAPEGHQIKQGTPTMGGIIILAGFFGSMPFVRWPIPVIPFALLVFLFCLIGFVDDYVVPKLMPGKRGLGWKQKILMQVVAAALPLFLHGGYSPIEFGLGMFVILFFANAYNFSDGLDGLAGTLAAILSVGAICLNTNRGFGLWVDAMPFYLLLGALLPFLYWNAPKAKVFMGDVGSLGIGAMFGGIWFLLRDHNPPGANTLVGVIALCAWSLMMVAELVPVPLQIASVKLRKKKLFPYTPIHHAFEKAGWPETRVVFVFAIVQVLCVMLALGILEIANIVGFTTAP